MNIELINKKDCSDNCNRYGKHTRYKRCSKCGTRKINLDLTELTNRSGRLNKYFLCNECDKLQEY